MDTEFERRWRAGEAPFNGFTLLPERALPLDRLRPALRAVLAALEDDAPDAPLYRWGDRHGQAVAATWPEVRQLLESDVALHVGACLSVFPANRRFYLRVRVVAAEPATRH